MLLKASSCSYTDKARGMLKMISKRKERY